LKAVGCEQCDYTGYKGRFAVCQVFHITEQVKELLLKNEIEKVKQILAENSLRNEIKQRVINQETTIEEANRIFCL